MADELRLGGLGLKEEFPTPPTPLGAQTTPTVPIPLDCFEAQTTPTVPIPLDANLAILGSDFLF